MLLSMVASESGRHRTALIFDLVLMTVGVSYPKTEKTTNREPQSEKSVAGTRAIRRQMNPCEIRDPSKHTTHHTSGRNNTDQSTAMMTCLHNL